MKHEFITIEETNKEITLHSNVDSNNTTAKLFVGLSITMLTASTDNKLPLTKDEFMKLSEHCYNQTLEKLNA